MRYLSCVHRPIFYACPHHTTKQVKQFLEEKNIEIIKRQGQSPDLNPICGEICGDKVMAKKPTTFTKL